MRLAQLARKISVKSADIVEFLSAQSVEIENNSNAKLDDVHVEWVLEQFAPELLEPETETQETERTEDIVDEVPEVAKAAEESKVEAEAVEPEEEPVEVIKPQKVELPGLKVVGKIELPEPKKKEEVKPESEGEVIEGENTPEAPRKPRTDNRGNRASREQDRRPRKNPIALQREREEREQLRKRQEEKQRQKDLRTRRYLDKVSKHTPAPKPTKRTKHEDEYEVYVEEKAKPKSFIGKILNWFVSE